MPCPRSSSRLGFGASPGRQAGALHALWRLGQNLCNLIGHGLQVSIPHVIGPAAQLVLHLLALEFEIRGLDLDLVGVARHLLQPTDALFGDDKTVITPPASPVRLLGKLSAKALGCPDLSGTGGRGCAPYELERPRHCDLKQPNNFRHNQIIVKFYEHEQLSKLKLRSCILFRRFTYF